MLPGSRSSSLLAGMLNTPGDTKVSLDWAVAVASSSRHGIQQAAPGTAVVQLQGNYKSGWRKGAQAGKVAPAACRLGSQQAITAAAAMQQGPAGVGHMAQPGSVLPARPPLHPQGERSQNLCSAGTFPALQKVSV